MQSLPYICDLLFAYAAVVGNVVKIIVLHVNVVEDDNVV